MTLPDSASPPAVPFDDAQPFGRRLALGGFAVIAAFFGTFYLWAATAPLEERLAPLPLALLSLEPLT